MVNRQLSAQRQNPATMLVDRADLWKQMQDITVSNDGNGADFGVRKRILQLLKAALTEGRQNAEELLKQDGLGYGCAKSLAVLQDDLLNLILDFALAYVYSRDNPSTGEQLAVVAVGGYGRKTLAPGSDIDLLFLLPYKQTPWGESTVEYILYMLWDMGLKVGHATRNIDECCRLSLDDITIRTAMLEARFICGEISLYDEMWSRYKDEVRQGTGAAYVTAKLGERDIRLEKAGHSRYLTEPNIKDGKGGLRDLHTLFWIAKYVYETRRGRDLVKKGVFSLAEYRLFKKCEDFLWSVRCHLHFLTGRPGERLTFEVQRELALRLGYTDHPGQSGVERFMKHYFLVAKDVGDLTRIFCAALEEIHAKKAPGLNRFFPRLPLRKRRTIKGTKDFVIENGRINSVDREVFANNPVNLIRVFLLANQNDLAFHPTLMQVMTRSLKYIKKSVREDREANSLFLEILISRQDPETTLRRMNESGVLGRFIPEFGKIVAMMQFSMYHHYTVDEHLLRTIGHLSSIERGNLGKEHPLAHEIIGGVKDRIVLYVAVFLHDIAKGRPEDHSIGGARIARKLCPRFGLSATQTRAVAWLIEEHLMMSTIAQSRDLADYKTIRDFAGVVHSLERMKMLLILTVCDITAVGPGVWNGWKGQLLRTLYYETEPHLTGGHSEITRDTKIAETKAALMEQATDLKPELLKRFVNLNYPPYWLRTELERIERHAKLVVGALEKDETFASEVKCWSFEDITEITVFAPDHPRLLAFFAGACSATGAGIVDAQIFTTSDGRALDTIFVRRSLKNEDDEKRRGKRIISLVMQGLSGEVRLHELLVSRENKAPSRKTFRLQPEVVINNTLSESHTVLELTGLDRPGLLFDITNALSSLNLDIRSAHISTFGEKAFDVFYVTDLTSHKIVNPARQTKIMDTLDTVLRGVTADRVYKRKKKIIPASN